VSAPLCALGEESKAVDDEAQLHEAAVDLRGFLELVARRFGPLGALTSREVDQVAHLHRDKHTHKQRERERERERKTAPEQLDREERERENGLIEYNIRNLEEEKR